MRSHDSMDLHQTNGAKSFRVEINSFLRKNAIAIVMIMLLVGFILSKGELRSVFFKASNQLSILRQLSTFLLISIGFTFVVIGGGIDLSVGSVLSFSGMVAAVSVANYGVPVWLGFLLGILSGVVIGAVNGFALGSSGIPPFILTIATYSIFKGLAHILSSGLSVRVADPGWGFLGNEQFLGFPIVFWIALIVLIPAWILLNRTTFGRNVYAVGENPQAASFSGISVRAVRRTLYILSGLTAAVAGILNASRLHAGIPGMGNYVELDAIAAVILGGMSMRGGTGRLSGTVFGCVLLCVMTNVLNILGVNTYWRYVMKGVIIFVGVSVEYLWRRKWKPRIR